VNTEDAFWIYKGFRATASAGKIPLKEGKKEVTRIDSIYIYRDAHPEAVYLNHYQKTYQVVDYNGKWKKAEWEHVDSEYLLEKWMHIVSSIGCAAAVSHEKQKNPINRTLLCYRSS
jgi:hypothetical protein